MSKMKFLTALIISSMVIACNDNDSPIEPQPEETGFFSPDVLKTGNKWVYWHYLIPNLQENPDEILFTATIDSVEVIGQGEYNGVSYSIVNTRRFISNVQSEEIISYQRITPSSHWVYFPEFRYPESEEDGDLLHPGEDFEFTAQIGTEPYGTSEYRLYETTNIDIDGTVYEIAPYKGIFTPYEEYAEMPVKIVEYNYNKDIGLINDVCPFVLGDGATSRRLKSFTPGD